MLIGTADVRSWINVPEGDKTVNPKLQTLLLAIQDFVEGYTSRQLEGTYYSNHRDFSIYDGNGFNSIYLRQYPISWVENVYVDSNRTWGSATLIPSADLIIDYAGGEIISEAGYFTKGRRNVRVDYIAGYGAATASSYPLPYDLKQVMIEMTVQAYKEGITGVHSVVGVEETKFIQLLSQNSMWRQTLNSYKNYAKGLG